MVALSTGDQFVIAEILKQQSLSESSPNPLASSDLFERFVCEQVLKTYELSVAELEQGIVDGSRDGGIDALFCFVNDVLVQDDTEVQQVRRNPHIDIHVIQAKYTKGFGEDAIHRLKTSMPALFILGADGKELRLSYNEQVVTIVENFHRIYRDLIPNFPSVEFHVHYATLGSDVNDNVLALIPSLNASVCSMFSKSSLEVRFVTARNLVDMYGQSPPEKLNLKTKQRFSSSDKAFVSLVGLSDYYDFITDSDGVILKTILDANGRDYQGNVTVNKGIRDSLMSQDTEFWWMNNGITITANDTFLSGDLITMTDVQIVNGL